jgi:hypothetical protein
MWHFGEYRGKELVVVGYNPRRGDCIVVELAALPVNESLELKRIVHSVPAQEQEYLVSLLKTMPSPDKIQHWFAYLCQKMQQRNGPVYALPLTQIQDSLDPDQRAIFKGYGQGKKNKYLSTLNEHGEPSGEPIVEEEPAPRRRGVNNQTVSSPQLETKIDAMLQAVVDGNRQTQLLLAKLIGALTDEEEEPDVEPEELPDNVVEALEATEWAAAPPKAKRPSRAKNKTNNAEARQHATA